MTTDDIMSLADEYATRRQHAHYNSEVEARDALRTAIETLQAELRRLHTENETLCKAYWKMRNAAAGFSNYCQDSASTRYCERDYTEAEELFRNARSK